MALENIPQAKVYKITCRKNGKVYVGVTTGTVSTRFNPHLSKLRNGAHFCTPLQADYTTYGEREFDVLPLETGDVADAEALEGFWIVKLRAFNPDKGYNRLGTQRIERLIRSPRYADLFSKITEDDLGVLNWDDRKLGHPICRSIFQI